LIGAPAGATIVATTGNFSWRPTTTGTYTFKVRATDNGSPALFDEEQITITVTTTLAARMINASTEEKIISPQETKISVYPNPTHDNVYVLLNTNNDEAVIQIFDMNGKMVSSSKQQINDKRNIPVNTSVLKPGTYIVAIKTKDATTSVKVVKL
jgi:hypothetical protein